MVKSKRFLTGDRVMKTMGVRLSGTVITPRYWRECTDGTYREPSAGDVCVMWDDKTFGYCSAIHLSIEVKK